MPNPTAPSAMAAVNWLDYAASIACDGEVPTLPASRLAIPRIAKRFAVAGLTPGDTVREVKIDLGQARTIDRIAAVRHRRNSTLEDRDGPVFASSDPVRHRLSTTDAHDGDVYDSGWIASAIVNGYGYHDHIVPLMNGAKRTARYASFAFDAQSRAIAPDDYVWWGRLGYFDMWRFDIGFAAPFSYGWRDSGTATRTLDGGGEIVNDTMRGWREISMIFKGVKALERPDLLQFLEKTRASGRFYLVADADVADPMGCVIARNLTPDIDQVSRAFNRFQLSLIESL